MHAVDGRHLHGHDERCGGGVAGGVDRDEIDGSRRGPVVRQVEASAIRVDGLAGDGELGAFLDTTVDAHRLVDGHRVDHHRDVDHGAVPSTVKSHVNVASPNAIAGTESRNRCAPSVELGRRRPQDRVDADLARCR